MENLTVISGSGEQFDLMLPAPEKLRQTVAVIRYLLKNDPSAGAPGIAPLLRCFFPPRCRKSLEKISLEDTLKLIHAFSFILKEHEKHNALSDSACDWGGEGERIPGGLAEEAAGTEKKSSDRTFPGYKEFSEGHICSGSEKKTLPVFSDLSYDNLVVKNGTEAIVEYANYDKMSKEEFALKYEALRIYCKQDTWAMVLILDALRNLVK